MDFPPKNHFLPRHFSQIGEVLDYFLIKILLFTFCLSLFSHQFLKSGILEKNGDF